MPRRGYRYPKPTIPHLPGAPKPVPVVPDGVWEYWMVEGQPVRLKPFRKWSDRSAHYYCLPVPTYSRYWRDAFTRDSDPKRRFSAACASAQARSKAKDPQAAAFLDHYRALAPILNRFDHAPRNGLEWWFSGETLRKFAEKATAMTDEFYAQWTGLSLEEAPDNSFTEQEDGALFSPEELAMMKRVQMLTGQGWELVKLLWLAMRREAVSLTDLAALANPKPKPPGKPKPRGRKPMRSPEYWREYIRAYRQRKREYMRLYRREYAKRNPEKMREYQKRHWAKIKAARLNGANSITTAHESNEKMRALRESI